MSRFFPEFSTLFIIYRAMKESSELPGTRDLIAIQRKGLVPERDKGRSLFSRIWKASCRLWRSNTNGVLSTSLFPYRVEPFAF